MKQPGQQGFVSWLNSIGKLEDSTAKPPLKLTSKPSLKIGLLPQKEAGKFQNHHFSGANC